MSEPLLVIGNGMAAAHFVDELTKRALGRYAIAVVGDEPQLAYNRVLLSSVLAGESAARDLELKPMSWWRDRGVTTLTGQTAVSIDPSIRRVRLASGANLPYRQLVLATGSRPLRPSIPGIDRKGVVTFRDLSDVKTISQAGPGSKAVVIGGGLLGLEAAYGLAKAGASVTAVHLMDRLMERQLDARAASLLLQAVEKLGITVLLRAETARIEGEQASAVVLTDGRALPADMVVVAAGISPNVALARTANVAINRGIVVDDGMQTSREDISAIGECAEHSGICYGLVEPACQQGTVLAERLSGALARYPGTVLSTNLKVSGVNVFSAGDFLGAAGTESIVLSDAGLRHYKKLVVANDRLVGAVLFGDTADGAWYLDLIRSGAPLGRLRGDLAFGRAFAQREAA